MSDDSQTQPTWVDRLGTDPARIHKEETVGRARTVMRQTQPTDTHATPCPIATAAGVKHDPVNHPRHYTAHPSGVECIQITEHMGFNLGNALKYIWRADLKGNAIEDLEKAVWYVRREIERRATKKAAPGDAAAPPADLRPLPHPPPHSRPGSGHTARSRSAE